MKPLFITLSNYLLVQRSTLILNNMEISINKTGNILTLKLTFITLSIDLNNIENTFDDMEKLARFIIPEDSYTPDNGLNELRGYYELFTEYINSYTDIDFNTDMVIDVNNKKMHFKNFKCTDYTLDLTSLLALSRKL